LLPSTGSGPELIEGRAGFGLGDLSWQNYHIPFEAILAEMGIEGESMVESVMVNQNETGAIDEDFVIVPNENSPRTVHPRAGGRRECWCQRKCVSHQRRLVAA
jgi:hypothetical protein